MKATKPVRNNKVLFLTLGILGLSVLSLPVFAQQGFKPKEEPPDTRMLVSMAPEAVELLRLQMREHLVAIYGILGAVAEGKTTDAADMAETQLGLSSMGRFRGNPFAPGWHMPVAMHAVANQSHKQATDWAVALRSGDRAKADAAFSTYMSSCIACHAAYRVR